MFMLSRAIDSEKRKKRYNLSGVSKKLIGFFLLLLILPLYSCSNILPEKYATPTFQSQCLPVFPDKNGWYGGDGAYSIKLDQERTLWLFGDTFVDRKEGRKDRFDMDFIAGTNL